MGVRGWWLWFVLVPVLVWGESFEISDYVVEARILSNGTLRMEETITVEFYEPRHGIYRTIPTRWRGDHGEHRFLVRDVAVSGFAFTTSFRDGLLTIRIGSASRLVEGSQVYRLSYTVENPIMVFSNTQGQPWQALYWNLIGTDWEVPIRRASFEVVLEKQWDQPAYTVFAGGYRSTNTDRVVASYDGRTRTLSGHVMGELAPHEGVTLLAAFPEGFWPVRDGRTFWQRYGVLVLGMVGVVYALGLFVLWLRFGKDKPFVRMVHFYPPAELHPAEAGMLIDNSVDQRDVVATIFHWAVEGYITIEEKPLLSGLMKDFILHKVKPLENPKDYERILWYGLFERPSGTFRDFLSEMASPGAGAEKESVRLSSLHDTFAMVFEVVRAEIAESVRDASLYKPYSRELGILCFVLGMLWLFGGIVLSAWLELWSLLPVALACALVSVFFAFIMPARTEGGQKYYEQLVGFRQFVKRADWPRLKRLLEEDPRYFDKTLPYAIVFGLEKRWVKRFAPVLTTPPSWYRGGSEFTPLYLASAIHSSIWQMGQVMSSSPSGSGSGGGGFSGGGGGGGGGGSW